MKLVFTKDDNAEITVNDNLGNEFKYINMVKSLIANKGLEEPEFVGDFSELEIQSVTDMIHDINSEVEKFYTEDDG